MNVEPSTSPGAPTIPVQPTSPVPAAHTTPAGTAGGAERRGLLLALAGVEFLLMLIPLFLPAMAAPVPLEGSGGPPCAFGGGNPGGPTVIDGCKSLQGADQSLALIAMVCAVMSVLVLPVLIGALSRRWQSAIALASAPFWVLTALLGLIVALARSGGANSAGINDPSQAYSQIFSLLFATPMVLMILIAGSLGGLAWLARRGLGR